MSPEERDPRPEPRKSRPGVSRTELDEVDQASVDSLPASDPPAFTPVTGSGAPAHADEAPPPSDEPEHGATH